MKLDLVGFGELVERFGLSRSQTYRLSKRPDFPEPGLTSGRRVWWTAEVEQWISEHRPDLGRDA
ncbi:helix-turn-helix transcriptional regulator [Actinoplanes sp. CA-142083]|uniref:helix-turn-helix transcriptional regulator n=1 Tax=Actinoplanes sp. CA-142083 TaxID=3239903 RepID=UPI003D8E8A04